MLGAGLDTTVVPWEPCVGHFLAGSDIDRMLEAAPDSDYKAFVRALIEHDRSRHVREGKGDRLFLIDPLAAAVVVEPAIVTKALRASVGVSLAPGLTRGMTVVDPSGRLGTPHGHPGRGGAAGPPCGAGRGVPHLVTAARG